MNNSYMRRNKTLFVLLLISHLFTNNVTEASVSSKSKVDLNSISDSIAQLKHISDAHSQFLMQLQKQLLDNQVDIDSLRGQIQENQYHLAKIMDCQKRILLQMNNLSFDNKNNTQSKIQVYDESLNALSSADTSMQLVTTTSNDFTDYNLAIALLQDKLHQDDAIFAFYNFIKKYPTSIYQPNANYWLGQLYYNKDQKDNAAVYFALVIKNYPKSFKAPDSMYKLGVIMQDKNNLVKAKIIYQQVINKYPGTDGARHAQERLSSIQ